MAKGGKAAARKGARIERKAKSQLEKEGWLVNKAGGSFGLFDLIAIHPDRDHAKLIQVKSNRTVYGKRRKKLESFQVPFFCRKEIWVHYDYEGFEMEVLP